MSAPITNSFDTTPASMSVIDPAVLAHSAILEAAPSFQAARLASHRLPLPAWAPPLFSPAVAPSRDAPPPPPPTPTPPPPSNCPYPELSDDALLVAPPPETLPSSVPPPPPPPPPAPTNTTSRSRGGSRRRGVSRRGDWIHGCSLCPSRNFDRTTSVETHVKREHQGYNDGNWGNLLVKRKGWKWRN